VRVCPKLLVSPKSPCRRSADLPAQTRRLSILSRPAFYNGRQMTLVPAFPFIDWRWLWLSVAAFLAGVLNAVAGGGSFLLFPALLGMKILPVQANATNAVAVWPGQLTSVAAYREDIVKNLRLALPMGWPAWWAARWVQRFC